MYGACYCPITMKDQLKNMGFAGMMFNYLLSLANSFLIAQMLIEITRVWEKLL